MKRQNPPNARFWHFHRLSWVKITLRPGQALHHSHSYEHDEGWSCEAFKLSYHVQARAIREEWLDSGTDCDGRHRSTGEQECSLADLHAVRSYGEEPMSYHGGERIFRPDWQKSKETECFDQFARAAGY